MNSESQAADQMVSMSLHGMDFIVRLAGDGAKNLIVLLAAFMKDNIQVKGRTTLNRMLRDGKEIKVFQIRNDQIRDFAAEAKRIGLLFTAIKDKSGVENCDILIRAEDASKVNRIIERMNLTKVDIATFKAADKTQPEVTRDAGNPTQARQVFSEPAVPNPSANLLVVFLSVILFSTAAYAEGDPLNVVNNLSTFIFSIIRAIGLILLGFGIVQFGLSLKSHDPSQRANSFLTIAGGIVITFSKEILDLITG